MRFPCTCLLVLALTPSATHGQDSQVSTSLPPDKDPEVFVRTGMTQNAQGHYDEAIDSFNRALQLDPQFASAYENRGKSRIKQGELIDAISDFTRALQIQPEYAEAFFDRGFAESAQGSFDAAITDFNHMIELQPESGDAFLQRAKAKYLKGDDNGAITDANEALTLDPSLNMAHFFRGLAEEAKGDDTKAAADLQQAARGGFAEAALWFWVVKMEAHQDQDAATQLPDLLSKALAGHPNPWLSELGDYLLEKTTDTQLIADAQQGKAGEDRPAQAWFFEGVTREFSGDTAGAQDAFKQAIGAGDKSSYLTAEARRQLKILQPSPTP